jgi:hypothetical protein
MLGWDLYKKYFNAWENATAHLVEQWMKSPLVLEPAAAWLTAFMKAKRASDDAAATAWGSLGVATKRDQERSLHALNQIQSRLNDLEEKLGERLVGKNADLPPKAPETKAELNA